MYALLFRQQRFLWRGLTQLMIAMWVDEALWKSIDFKAFLVKPIFSWCIYSLKKFGAEREKDHIGFTWGAILLFMEPTHVFLFQIFQLSILCLNNTYTNVEHFLWTFKLPEYFSIYKAYKINSRDIFFLSLVTIIIHTTCNY